MISNIRIALVASLCFSSAAAADTCMLRLYFPFDSAVPDPVAVLVIKQFLQYNPKVNTIALGGFADRVGSSPYNIVLSKRRADIVRNYFTVLSVGQVQVKTAWFGYAYPVVPTDSPEALNRRVEVIADNCTRPWLFNPMPQPLDEYEVLLRSPARTVLEPLEQPNGILQPSGASSSQTFSGGYASATTGPGTASAAYVGADGSTMSASADASGARAASAAVSTTSSSSSGASNSSSAYSGSGQAAAAYAGSSGASAAYSGSGTSTTSYSGASSVNTSSGSTSVSVGTAGISISRP